MARHRVSTPLLVVALSYSLALPSTPPSKEQPPKELAELKALSAYETPLQVEDPDFDDDVAVPEHIAYALRDAMARTYRTEQDAVAMDRRELLRDVRARNTGAPLYEMGVENPVRSRDFMNSEPSFQFEHLPFGEDVIIPHEKQEVYVRAERRANHGSKSADHDYAPLRRAEHAALQQFNPYRA